MKYHQGRLNLSLAHDDCIRIEYNASCFLLRGFFQGQDHFKGAAFVRFADDVDCAAV